MCGDFKINQKVECLAMVAVHFFVLRTPFSGFCQKLLIIKHMYTLSGTFIYLFLFFY